MTTTDDPNPVRRPGGGGLAAYPVRGTHRPQPRPEALEARRRAEAQRHLDARGERLRAFAAALEAAAASPVGAGPPAPRRAQLERQLARVRHDLRAAGRTHLPEPPVGAGAAGTPAPTGDARC